MSPPRPSKNPHRHRLERRADPPAQDEQIPAFDPLPRPSLHVRVSDLHLLSPPGFLLDVGAQSERRFDPRGDSCAGTSLHAKRCVDARRSRAGRQGV